MSSLARPLASLALSAMLALGAGAVHADEPASEHGRAPSAQLEGEGMAVRWPSTVPGAAFALSLAPDPTGATAGAALVESRTWGPLGASLRLGLESGPAPAPSSAASAWLDEGALALSIELRAGAPAEGDGATLGADACLVLRHGHQRFIAFAAYEPAGSGAAGGIAWALPTGSW